MLHLFVEILRNSVLITGLVAVMMMMIESLNIESRGMIFNGLRKTKAGQVVIGALLGSVPGCMGGFATVSLYTHGLFSFGALVAMMIASSGDEAFIMLAMIPDKALMIFVILFSVAVAVGLAVDFVLAGTRAGNGLLRGRGACGAGTDCTDGYAVHEHEAAGEQSRVNGAGDGRPVRHFGWKRAVMAVGLAAFIAALASGMLAHDHGAHGHGAHGHETQEYVRHEAEGLHAGCTHECPGGHVHGTADDDVDARLLGIDLLSEDWMNVLFAALSVAVLLVLLFGSDHFVEEHLWHHIVRKHVPVIFAWTFGVLVVLGVGMQYVDIGRWISGNTAMMILLATAVGIIPESGPHMIFVTLYASGVVPLPVLLASCISQDGHASIPLLAESKRSFIWAKLINCAVAIAAGFIAMAFM